jgi:hypothetical protein
MAKKCSLVGSKIQLISTDDPYTKLKPGDVGTITHIDDTGTVFADWENGSALGLIPNIDNFKILSGM